MGLGESLRADDAGAACLRRFETVERSGPAFVRLRRGKHGSAGRWSGSLAGAGMERSGTGLNRRSQARKPADVSWKAAFGDSSAVKGLWGSRCRIPASVGIILAMETVSTSW